MEQSIGSYVENAMRIFGKEVNSNRALPFKLDGLKPVYRRTIYSALNNGTKMVKSASIVGNVIGTTHPHGTQSVDPVVSNLVRWGIFEGQGNHGLKSLIGDNIEPSATRYTEARVSDKFLKIFSNFMSYVPYVEAELEGNKEPLYLPTPIPLCLLFGSLGLGVGVNSRVPAFTVKSMINALNHDDPSLLEAPFGLHIIKDKSNLNDLWNQGLGAVTYQYDVKDTNTAAGRTILISGEAELFKPKLTSIQKQIDWGRCYSLDMTDESGSKVGIIRNYNVKAVSYDELLEYAKAESTSSKVYRLTVTDENGNAYVIPLKYWLKECMENYVSIIHKYKETNLARAKFNYEVYKFLPKIAELILNNKSITNEELVSKSGASMDIVNEVLKKSINTLRSSDTSAQLNKYQNQIDYYTNLEPSELIDSIINEF